MPIPAYMWLTDDGGAAIRGSTTVQGREGSIEVIGFNHGLSIPVDSRSGQISGTRSHANTGLNAYGMIEVIAHGKTCP